MAFRISQSHSSGMKKFKFHTTTDVFMQCKIRACAAQPCGTCDRRRLASSPDLSPVEGEMFAPPTKIRVSRFDKNALVFQAQQYVAPAMPASGVSAAVAAPPALQKAIQISSEMTLPVTQQWAEQNRAQLVSALSSTLGLKDGEVLTILSISSGARRLAEEARQLQSAGTTRCTSCISIIGYKSLSHYVLPLTIIMSSLLPLCLGEVSSPPASYETLEIEDFGRVA
jgi:hypothetical protein